MEEFEEEEKNSNINQKYFKSNKLKICCVTWNMHGLNPTQKEIESLLDPHQKFDIYAIGSEECLRSIFKSLFYSDKTIWETNLKNYFNRKYKEKYELISSETLCAIHLVIFIKESLIKDISKVRVNKVNWEIKGQLALVLIFSIYL